MDWRLTVAQHAAERAATQAHRELARGLGGLATVASTAVFLGILWTVWGLMFYSFPGLGTEKTTAMAITAGLMSQSIVPTAFGLGVAIVASWGHQHFKARLSEFDLEMQHAAEKLPGIIAAGLRAGS